LSLRSPREHTAGLPVPLWSSISFVLLWHDVTDITAPCLCSL
jgi:hypothetical protein